MRIFSFCSVLILSYFVFKTLLESVDQWLLLFFLFEQEAATDGWWSPMIVFFLFLCGLQWCMCQTAKPNINNQEHRKRMQTLVCLLFITWCLNYSTDLCYKQTIGKYSKNESKMIINMLSTMQFPLLFCVWSFIKVFNVVT